MEIVFANNASNQSEMPFALVQGEPLTVIPQDLYIPPDALLRTPPYTPVVKNLVQDNRE